MCQVERQIQREVAAHFDVCMEKLKVGECRDMTRNLAPRSPDICHSMSSIIRDPFSWLYLVTSCDIISCYLCLVDTKVHRSSRSVFFAFAGD